MMLSDGDVVSLRRDTGGRFLLGLRRIGPGAIGQRVRIVGIYVGDDLVDVDKIQLV